MSIALMSRVWSDETIHCRKELILLLAIADYANEKTGEAWPSIETLARKTRCSERSVQRIINQARENGRLEVKYKEGPYGSNMFKLVLSPPSDCHHPRQTVQSGGDKTGTGGGDRILPVLSPKPLTTVNRVNRHNKEPLTNTRTRASKAKASLDELKAFTKSIDLPESDGEACFYKWEGNGWKNGKNPIKDWKSTIRSWKAAGYLPSQKPSSRLNGTPPPVRNSDAHQMKEAVPCKII